MDTVSSIKKIISPAICTDVNVYHEYEKRVEAGQLTRDENPQTHICAYFLPYNSRKNEVFMVHHKKSGLWISPGGHIDRGETIFETLNREIKEELGVADFFEAVPEPFLLTITPIENKIQPCKKHFDIWYLMLTDGSNFNIDPQEFHATSWLTIEAARKIVTNLQNLEALDCLKTIENKEA